GRQLVEEILQARRVALQERRKLEEQRAELALERACRLAEVRGEVGRVAQAQLVGDAARRLQSEGEVVGRVLRPALQLANAGGAVEGVVDLDRREAGGVIAQHLGVGQAFRIEAPLPLLVRIARRADPVRGHLASLSSTRVAAISNQPGWAVATARISRRDAEETPTPPNPGRCHRPARGILFLSVEASRSARYCPIVTDAGERLIWAAAVMLRPLVKR